MNGAQGGSLQNVLSISTAANNRYLLHFNSLNSLTQWTAGIRLAMFEHSTLQEAYTGSLIAGKGRYLNNIKQIMFRTTFAYEDWARVRFGAGTPWRRCWCVIQPPDEKEFQKAQKTLKKSSAYEKPKMPRGEIKFYDTRKVTKKTRPIATISEGFAAYAIYPQSKPLIDQSTLVKIEGLVTVDSAPQSSTEGFVFVMPEVHAAVTGFEIMLRFLFPVFDVFNLYGRPTKLVADTLDQRGLMFAMPRDRRYGYLDILDVSSLIHAKGSHNWSERHWRREMKKLTADRMMNQTDDQSNDRQPSQRRNTTNRVSMPPSRTGVRFGSGDDDDENYYSAPGSRSASPSQIENRVPRTDSAPPTGAPFTSPHKRSVSEAQGYRKYQSETPSRLSYEAARPGEEELPPAPPQHGGALGAAMGAAAVPRAQARGRLERIQSEPEVPTNRSMQNPAASPHLIPPEPVSNPPAFTHQPNSRPANQPYQAPELRRAHSNVDAATLYQMQAATRAEGRTPEEEQWNGDVQQRQQNTVASQSYTNRNLGVPADRSQGVVNRNQRDPRQRLSTIPGSPFIEDAETFQSPQQTAAPPTDRVIEEPQQPNREAPPVPLHSKHSIARKPLPRPLPPAPPMERAASDPGSPTSVTNTGSWDGGIIDEEALDRVLNQDNRQNTMHSTTTASTEPDYASTEASSIKGPKQSIERPRAGKLKTVGDPDLHAFDPRSGGAGRLDTWEADQAAMGSEIPSVNFGPTYAYKPNPNSRPGTSGTLTPGEKRRSRSVDRLTDGNRLSGMFGQSPRASPSEGNRYSYFADGRNTPSPGGRATPEYGNFAENRNSAIWQPGASPSRYNRNNSVSPEQWVAQRAALAQQPQYALPAQKKAIPNLEQHGRSYSMQTPRRKLTKTPPLGRTLSGDWTQAARGQTPPNRPSSRGASANLDGIANLSAREQMQVSRATGSPLVNISSNGNKQYQQQQQQPGLIGHLQARERDKAASKEGRNSMAVQQAISRQQQQQNQIRVEAEAQAQREYQIQMQQQMAYNQQMMAQNQMQMQMQYGGQGQPPPQYRNNSWQQQQQAQQQAPPGYYAGSPGGGQQYGPPSGVQFSPPPGGYYGSYSPHSQQPYSPQGQQQQYSSHGQQQQYPPGYFQQQQGWGRR